MRLPVSSGGASRSEGRGRGAARSGGRGSGAARSRGRGRGTARSGGRGGEGGREGATSSSISSVPQASHSVDPTDDDYDPDLENSESEVDPDDLWERGPTGLPPAPTREEEKILLTPEGDTQWGEENVDGRLPNGILGVLVREAFPGIVKYKGRDEPAWHWQQYNLAEDTSDEGDVHYGSALERVEESFWWWFRWPDGMENAARTVVRNVVKKLIPQIFYEGRIQSVITYHSRVLGKKIKRAQACQIYLTLEEYMEAIPWWAQKAPEAWQLAAELRWCNDAWKVKSHAAKAHRGQMGGASHRQGSCSHTRWKKKVEKIKKRPVSDVEAYTTGRMGNQEGTYCNPRVAANIEAYTEAAKELHGPEFDAMNAPLDNVAVYRAGRGKKHGRYLIADGFINTHSTLSEVQASGCQSQNERPQRCQQAYPRSGFPQQEIEARKILEEKLDNQTETINCLKEGYAALASSVSRTRWSSSTWGTL